MPRVVVIHYAPAEGAALAQRIRTDGLEAEAYAVVGASGLSAIRANPPDAIVIDLMRMPSYGRAIGGLLRAHKTTRCIPLVFVEGDPAKTALVRRLLPDAVFTKLPGLPGAIQRALRKAPAEPVQADPSRIPLWHKLKVRPGVAVALLHAPPGLKKTLGELPKGATLQSSPSGASVLAVFVKSVAGLGAELPAVERYIRQGRSVWLVWPKKSSGHVSDISLPRILEMCEPRGLTGYMTCAVDATWSAVAVAVRRRLPARAAQMPS